MHLDKANHFVLRCNQSGQLSRWLARSCSWTLGYFSSSTSTHYWFVWGHFLPAVDHVFSWKWMCHLDFLDHKKPQISGNCFFNFLVSNENMRLCFYIHLKLILSPHSTFYKWRQPFKQLISERFMDRDQLKNKQVKIF